MEPTLSPRTKRFVACLLGTVWWVLGGPPGCAEQQQTYGPVHLAPSSRPFERDVPVPIGFSFIESASEDASSGSRRLYLRHTYAGQADKISVRNFYREHMPLARWVKVSDGNVKGVYTLQYRKDAEWCSVQVSDWNGARGGVQIVVIITQRRDEPPPPVGRP